MAVLLAACGRGEEIEVLSRSRSPDGLHEATVEVHVYGPHFGGETPAVEVHVRRVRPAEQASGLVFQASAEHNDVSVQWIGTTRLVITHSSGVPVDTLNPFFDGVLVEQIAK